VGTGSFGRYVLIGGTGLAIDLGLFVLLLTIGVNPILANVVSAFLAITNNYLLNTRLNFMQSTGVLRGLRFFSVGLLGLVLTTVFLHFLMVAGMLPVAAKVVVLSAVLVAQYFGNKNWTFRVSKPENNPSP
jgi:dolichol-phosphate mannosyltransferase